MSEYQIARQEPVNGVLCDFYTDSSGEFFMTRQQIGEALEYENPRQAIGILHKKHKERLDRYSTVFRSNTVEGGREVQRERVLYSAKGIYEICRWSRQPKADAFYDQVYDILEGLRTGRLVPLPGPARLQVHEAIDSTVMEFFQCLEKALAEERYYLLPRTAQEEYPQPYDKVLGVWDNCFYYLRGLEAVNLFREVHPDIGKRNFYGVLRAAGLLIGPPNGSYDARTRRGVDTVAVPICGKKRRCLKLLRRRLPLQLTTYGENKYYLVDKIGMSEEEYRSFTQPDEW